MSTVKNYHIPVLVNEVLESLALKPGGIYVDATLGGAGHARAILTQEPTCQLIGIDWDTQALEKNGVPLAEEFPDRVRLIWGNFSRIDMLLKKEGVKAVDGILADFGTSQFQLFQRAGFSFYHDSPLDMRMSPAHQKITAAEVLNKASETTLADIFFAYGQERHSRLYARLIAAERLRHPFATTRQLAQLIERHAKKPFTLHPATKVFQALRIHVNRELDNIRSFLPAALRVLNSKGRLVCISFHSLEDVLVKDFFKEHEQSELTIITPKGITASSEEVQRNPASRSARLRAAEFRKSEE